MTRLERAIINSIHNVLARVPEAAFIYAFLATMLIASAFLGYSLDHMPMR